ncbi:hypothetical protein BKA69DRAFT_1121737 [Paraphysoderma sedebokerense]|nr:hypothetical protein BKA69DRAFT_1121737 [Paraphysoderma sedebokerense]
MIATDQSLLPSPSTQNSTGSSPATFILESNSTAGFSYPPITDNRDRIGTKITSVNSSPHSNDQNSNDRMKTELEAISVNKSGMLKDAINLQHCGDPEENRRGRRIVAEVLGYNLLMVETLTNLCIRSIVQNFEKTFNLSSLPPKYKSQILSSISTDLPLRIAVTLNDESYWRRRSKDHLPKNCDIRRHDNSWKILYLERYTAQQIENCVPHSDNMTPLFESLKLVGSNIKRLDLKQMQPRQISSKERNGLDQNPDHLDISTVLCHLNNLKSLSISYRKKDVGMNFDWRLFGMTLNDCNMLCKALRRPSLQLESLSIRQSGVDDERLSQLCESLKDLISLRKLDLSHNKISEIGTRALGQLLALPSCQIKTLNVANNKINAIASGYLSSALLINKCLKSLNIRMNHIGDEGGKALIEALRVNAVLEELDLCSTGISKETVAALAVVLQPNNGGISGLRMIDLSCNRFASSGKDAEKEEAEKIIWDALKANKILDQLIRAKSSNKVFTK